MKEQIDCRMHQTQKIDDLAKYSERILTTVYGEGKRILAYLLQWTVRQKQKQSR